MRAVGKIVLEQRVVHGRKETFVTEGDMPPPERPKPRRQEGEQDHLREDAGVTQEGLVEGKEPAQPLREDAGQPDRAERKDQDKGLLDKARDKLTGQ